VSVAFDRDTGAHHDPFTDALRAQLMAQPLDLARLHRDGLLAELPLMVELSAQIGDLFVEAPRPIEHAFVVFAIVHVS